jgi:hypothetical protein
MAAHIDHPAQLAVPRTSYAEIRPQVQSGDLLFCSGNYLISHAIRTVTHSPWSHVGLILRVDAMDRVLLFESVEDVGVRLAPISLYITDYENGKPYNGNLVLARTALCTEDVLKSMALFGADQLARPYGNKEIGEILARVTLHIGRVDKAAGWVCSELVNACFSEANAPLTCDHKGFVTPEDVWREPSVEPFALIQ